MVEGTIPTTPANASVTLFLVPLNNVPPDPRTSHTDDIRGVQLLPNDDREQERLDYMHHVFRLTLDGELHYSKLDNPQRILDIGTGTGTLGSWW